MNMTWYACPDDMDESIFKNWQKLAKKPGKVIFLPDRSCVECKKQIMIQDYMIDKDLSFKDALFDFKHSGVLLCPECHQKINKGKLNA